MKRKLVRQGSSTMMVSLPSKWIKANSLDKGDEIGLEESGNALMISPKEASKAKKETTIKLSEENKHDIYPILTHLYRKGFSKITIENTNPHLMKQIRQITAKLLLGFELTETHPSKCTIENISEPTEDKYDIMMRKVFLILEESLQMLALDFVSNKLQNLEEMEETRNNQDKFVLFCKRLLTKGIQNKNQASEWELLTFLLHIQHAICYLYKFAAENKIKSESQMNSLLDSAKEYFALFKGAYYNSDIKSVHKINSLKQTYQFGKCLTALEKSKGKNAIVYSYIREIFRLIQIATSPILSEVLEKEIKD